MTLPTVHMMAGSGSSWGMMTPELHRCRESVHPDRHTEPDTTESALMAFVFKVRGLPLNLRSQIGYGILTTSLSRGPL